MDHRADRDQLLDGIDALVLQAELAHKRDPGINHPLSQMAQVEVHHLAIGSFNGAALLHFLDEGLAEAVTRAQFHVAQSWFGRRCAQVVVLQIAVAILVQQMAALRARCFGNKNPCEGQAGRMILHKLHVL